MDKLGLPTRYVLKVAQRCQIAQLEDLGFSPYVVARMSGHSLRVQEEHYTRPDNYLPADKGRSLGKFDTLTETGRRVRDKYRDAAADPLPDSGGRV